MEAKEWDDVLDQVKETIGVLLQEQSPRMLAAYENHEQALTISLGATITGQGAFSVDMKASIGYVVEKVKSTSGDIRIMLKQDPLPGMSQATSSGKPSGRGGGSISVAQAKGGGPVIR
jgi:hypothetical protein